MRQINNVQRAVRTALGAAKGYTAAPPATMQIAPDVAPWGTTSHVVPPFTTTAAQPPPVPTPTQQPELQKFPGGPRGGNRYTSGGGGGGGGGPRTDIITSMPIPPQYTTQVVPTAGGYSPVPPCGPSPCCRQYDWQWWNTAKI